MFELLQLSRTMFPENALLIWPLSATDNEK